MKYNKKSIIISGFLLLLIIASLFLFLVFRKNDSNKHTNKTNTTITDKVVDDSFCQSLLGGQGRDNCYLLSASKNKNIDLCQKIDDNQSISFCRDTVFLSQAKEGSDIALCDNINSEVTKFSCISEVVKNNLINENNCSVLSKESKATCLDAVLLKQAIENNNVLLCESISLNRTKESCFTKVINQQVDFSYCDNLAANSDQQKKCVTLITLRKAYQDKNPDMCNKISDDNIKNNCLKNLTASIDSDGDGLTNQQETDTYHTNPSNPDTDGDGYSDGEEVKNGYNPNGSGKLINE